MSPRNWPDLTHGCKLSQLETTVQPIIHSGQHQVSRPSDRDQIPVGVPSCSSCLPSGVTLYWFSWAYLFLQEQQPNRLLQTLPKGCDFTDVHVSIHVIPSSDLVGPGRRKEVELGEALDKSKPQPCALLSALLSLFPWACCGCCTALCSCLSWHSLYPLRRHKDWGLSVLCNLKPHKGQVFVSFCVYLRFLNHCKSAILL